MVHLLWNAVSGSSRRLRRAHRSGLSPGAGSGCRLMSAKGQKQTLRGLNGMSALPPKADIRRHERDVRFSNSAGWGQALSDYSRRRCRCRSRAPASLRNRHIGRSIMGFEDEVERSFRRPCRPQVQADSRTHLIHRPARERPGDRVMVKRGPFQDTSENAFSSNKTPWKTRARAPPVGTNPARRRCHREGSTARVPVWSPP